LVEEEKKLGPKSNLAIFRGLALKMVKNGQKSKFLTKRPKYPILVKKGKKHSFNTKNWVQNQRTQQKLSFKI